MRKVGWFGKSYQGAALCGGCHRASESPHRSGSTVSNNSPMERVSSGPPSGPICRKLGVAAIERPHWQRGGVNLESPKCLRQSRIPWLRARTVMGALPRAFQQREGRRCSVPPKRRRRWRMSIKASSQSGTSCSWPFLDLSGGIVQTFRCQVKFLPRRRRDLPGRCAVTR